MKKLSLLRLCVIITVTAVLSLPVSGQKIKNEDKTDFTGQWTLDIEGGGVGWLEIVQQDGYMDGKLLWKGGSVNPVANIYMDGPNRIVVSRNMDVVRSRDENRNPLRTQTITSWLVGSIRDNVLKGYYINPQRDGQRVDSSIFTGYKLPEPETTPDLTAIRYGEPKALFNGRDLTGWRVDNEKAVNGFIVEDGVLINNVVKTKGQPAIRNANLLTAEKFGDCNLKLEVNIPKGSNSGVYLRGMYEIQVLDSYDRPLDSHHMGAVYSRITPSVKAEKPSGEWQTLDITLYKRHITVILNGVKIIDNKPVEGPTGGAMVYDVFAPGPILLQGDHGYVAFRNIVITPIL
jgi:hypothetical protein